MAMKRKSPRRIDPQGSAQALGLVLGSLNGAAALNAHHAAPWCLPVLLAASLWRWLAARRGASMPSGWLRGGLTLLMTAAVLVSFRTLNGAAAGSTLLVTMCALKLFETRSRRDLALLCGASLFLLLAACLDAQALWRLPLYGAELWLLATALRALGTAELPRPLPALFGAAGRSLLLALPLAIGLFVLFPRLPGGFWALNASEEAMTGLGEEMSPGSISRLSESDEVALRVRFDGPLPPPAERYWRGPVLHDFDGYTWRRARYPAVRHADLTFLGPAYAYEVTLEPNAHNVLLALELPEAAPTALGFYGFDYALQSAHPLSHAIAYRLISRPAHRSADALTRYAARLELALPAGRNARTLALAQSLRAAAASDADFVRAVLRLFRQGGFEYTLTPPRLDLDSVDDFLFNTRRGFCGHYASAFVALMRAGGVPSRVVTGYLGGEWNPIGHYLTVRQSHAHAWAEVWLPGAGWTRVDPTAIVAPERLTRDIADLLPDMPQSAARRLRAAPWIGQFLQGAEALNAWWQDQFVGFNLTRQLGLLERLGLDAQDWGALAAVLAGAGLIWAGAVLWLLRRAPPQRRPDALGRAWQALGASFARFGLARAPHEGPLAWRDRLERQSPPLAAEVEGLAERYARARFGPAPDSVALPALLRALRRARRRVRGLRAVTFPPPWRAVLTSNCALYQRVPPALRARAEQRLLKFLQRVEFYGCQGLSVTLPMRLSVSFQACLLAAGLRADPYTTLRSVLLYPDEFVVNDSEVDEAGVVTDGERALAGQSFDATRIILSWADVLATGEGYNVVVHEFAHYLDHWIDGAWGSSAAQSAALQSTLATEYAALCAAVQRAEDTLIDPYGAQAPEEFFATASEAFVEAPEALRARHPALYAALSRIYALDPASWRADADVAQLHATEQHPAGNEQHRDRGD